MPDPGVSLIPRGSKSTKKKRTSFRPASKKSNQNKSKTSTASSAAKASKAIVPKKPEESTISTTEDVAAPRLPAQADSAQTTPTPTADANANAENNDGSSSQPVSPTTKISASQSLPEEKSSAEDEIIAENETTVAAIKEPIPPRTTRASAATSASSATKPSTRKRKAHSLNKKISIGSSFRRTAEISSDALVSPIGNGPKNNAENRENPESTGNNIVSVSKPKRGEGTENDPKTSAIEPKTHASTTAIITSSVIVPEFSAHDQAILQKLASEEREGKSLNSFCTPFRGPKRKLDDKERSNNKNNPSSAAATNSSSNKDKHGNANDLALNGASDSSAANNNRNESDQTVDANTIGAPSVQIIDGQIVLQESSVMLPARRTVQEVEEEFRDNVVEEDEQFNIVKASYTSFVTKGDHGKTRKKGSWTIEETEKFYLALQQLGTDFGSMEALFFEDQRTRKQLKNKYRKELAKNPDLVQELALNPKYQIELDMSAHNLEVDPERIEAHKNEEPPAYEPTDGEVVESSTSTKKSNGRLEGDGIGNDYNGVFDGEVVEEDAEEERRAEARANQEGNNNPTSTKVLSSDAGDDPKEPEFGEGDEAAMGGFPRESDAGGPSMDDFFGDSYGEDPATANEPSSTKKEEALSASSPPSAAAAAAAATTAEKEASEMVSLVPKKTKSNTKSRRPKIRPSRRKK